MTTENENVSPQEAASAAVESQEEKRYTSQEVSEMMEKRLKNKQEEHERKMGELKSRVKELESKEKAGTASLSEQLELSKGQEVAAKVQNPNAGIDPSFVPYIVKQEMEKEKFNQKLRGALDKDEEFKKLASAPDADQRVGQEAMDYTMPYDNAPAMLKYLLKDRRESELLNSKLAVANDRRDPSIVVEYLNNLSRQLDKSATAPRPSSYVPDPDLSDMGNTGQDFNLEDYVKSKL